MSPDGKLKWEKMPENFEKFVYPGLVFDVPSDPVVYRDRLIAAFPHERTAIDKYFEDIRDSTSHGITRQFMTRFLPGPASRGIRELRIRTATEHCVYDNRGISSRAHWRSRSCAFCSPANGVTMGCLPTKRLCGACAYRFALSEWRLLSARRRRTYRPYCRRDR